MKNRIYECTTEFELYKWDDDNDCFSDEIMIVEKGSVWECTGKGFVCDGENRLEDAEGGAFYPGDDSESYVHHGLIVNAWRPLPAAYKEGMVTTNADRIRAMSDEQLADEMLEYTDVCEKISFCHNDQMCNDTLDRGELIEKEMCKRCLMNWLGKEKVV